MAQSIDFNGLLKDLFQEPAPIEKKVQRYTKPQKNSAAISKALGELFQTAENSDVEKFSTSTERTHSSNEANVSFLQACNLYVFMRKIVMECFGMGHDYAVVDRKCIPLKSWFSIPEAIEAAERQGYRLTVADCRAYLDELIRQRYIETDGYKYRRSMIWCEQMESYLLRSLRSSHA